MMFKLKVTVLFVVCFSMGFAQSVKFEPQNLGTNVNTTYDEVNPLPSPDGKTLYFVRVNHPENRYGENSQDVWNTTLLDNGQWSVAERLPDNVNIARYNALLSVSTDGKSFLMQGIYTKKGDTWKKRGLSIITLTDAGWSLPSKVDISNLNDKVDGDHLTACFTPRNDALILAFSHIYNSDKSDLYFCVKDLDGNWTRPKLIKMLSSENDEHAPFMSFDGKVMYFSSNRDGQFDIFKSDKKGDSWENWGIPLPVDLKVNSSGWESYFKTDAKGEYGFYSSTNNSFGASDIFRVKLIESRPYIALSGALINKENQAPYDGAFDLNIYVNDELIDSLSNHYDSAHFKINLPFGHAYTFVPAVSDFLTDTIRLDLTKVKEYAERTQNLYVSPVPITVVTGNVLIQGTEKPVPPKARPVLLVDGLEVDSAIIDKNNAAYQVFLTPGFSYKVFVEAEGYVTLLEVIDLTSDNRGAIQKDLFVGMPPVAEVKGKILNQKTGETLPKYLRAMVMANGERPEEMFYNDTTGEYRITLDLGEEYDLNASANGFYAIYETIDLTGETEHVEITKDLLLVPIEVGQSITLENIFFDTGKSSLKPESFDELDKVYTFLSENPDIKIEIGGHTDNVGDAGLNQRLSEARAQSVANYLIGKGISIVRIKYKGYGMTKPVASNDTPEGKQKNRRVEFTILDN